MVGNDPLLGELCRRITAHKCNIRSVLERYAVRCRCGFRASRPVGHPRRPGSSTRSVGTNHCRAQPQHARPTRRRQRGSSITGHAGLVDLGVVERREIPPSSQFRLIRENVAAQAIIELARSRDTALDRIGAAATALPLPPVSVIVFGSFARGQADEHSDLDAIIVRPDDVDEDDDAWATTIEQWRNDAQAITGNRVEILELARHEAETKLAGRAPLWRDSRSRRRRGPRPHETEQLMKRVHA